MNDGLEGLRQLITVVEHTKCPICKEFRLKYEEELIKPPSSYFASDFLVATLPYLERKIKCNNCKKTFGFNMEIQDKVLIELELFEL